MIVVTGASKGIGRKICESLVSHDVEVLGLARNVDGLNFPSLQCDITSIEQIKKVARLIKERNLNVSGLVNAAGIASMNLAVMTPADTTKKIIDVNLLGTIFTCQVISPLMIRNKNGRIINFSTIAVPLGLRGESIYVASKSGVEGFTRAFAREMADFNITVNCISPGPIATDLIKGVEEHKIQSVVANQIIPKQFSTQDIFEIVEFLLFDERSQCLTGQVFNIGGA